MLIITRTVSIRVPTNHEEEIRKKLKEIYGSEPRAYHGDALIGTQTMNAACFNNLILRQEHLDKLLDWASEAPFLVSIQY